MDRAVRRTRVMGHLRCRACRQGESVIVMEYLWHDGRKTQRGRCQNVHCGDFDQWRAMLVVRNLFPNDNEDFDESREEEK